jgi:hypothetical protein
MTDERKHALLLAATILAARRLVDWDGAAAAPKHLAAIADAVRIAERILAHIDERHPTEAARAEIRKHECV